MLNICTRSTISRSYREVKGVGLRAVSFEVNVIGTFLMTTTSLVHSLCMLTTPLGLVEMLQWIENQTSKFPSPRHIAQLDVTEVLSIRCRHKWARVRASNKYYLTSSRLCLAWTAASNQRANADRPSSNGTLCIYHIPPVADAHMHSLASRVTSGSLTMGSLLQAEYLSIMGFGAAAW